MLPRSSRRLRARLDGQAPAWLCVAGWRELQVVQELSVDCERPDIELTDVIDALGTGLERLQEQHSLAGLRCDVIVADMWLAYDVIGGDLANFSPAWPTTWSPHPSPTHSG